MLNNTSAQNRQYKASQKKTKQIKLQEGQVKHICFHSFHCKFVTRTVFFRDSYES